VVQPYGAIMYRINNPLSWYASYADIYRGDQVELRTDGTLFGPLHGATLESGIKGAWRDSALNGYLALYHVKQRNVPVQPVMPNGIPLCCYRSGTGLSRGVELGIDGELAPGWLIGSGYTYNLYDPGTALVSETSTPRHLLKVWTSARLTGAFSRWTIGGTLHAQTASLGGLVPGCLAPGRCGQNAEAIMRSYAILGLRAGYQISANWQVALSVNNVFDKSYILSQDTNTLALWYGEPRNFMLRIDAKY
jgi:outer membrane receptor for ferric coprogen and ferric-rhodotorulic acid